MLCRSLIHKELCPTIFNEIWLYIISDQMANLIIFRGLGSSKTLIYTWWLNRGLDTISSVSPV